MTENFRSSEVQEDSVLEHLVKSGREISFAGDYIWTDMFGKYFTDSFPEPSLNVRDLDTLDRKTFLHLKRLLTERKKDLTIGHVVGIDHAGHTYGSDNEHIERKILETEAELKQVINLLDDDTTLIVFGDHGMTEGGNHGGGSEMELRSVLFAYRKSGFKHSELATKHLR